MREREKSQKGSFTCKPSVWERDSGIHILTHTRSVRKQAGQNVGVLVGVRREVLLICTFFMRLLMKVHLAACSVEVYAGAQALTGAAVRWESKKGDPNCSFSPSGARNELLKDA